MNKWTDFSKKVPSLNFLSSPYLTKYQPVAHLNKPFWFPYSLSNWTSLSEPHTKIVVFWSQRYFFLTFHLQRNKTCLLWLRLNLPLMNRPTDSVLERRLQPSVGVPDWQIRVCDSQWHPGRVPRSLSSGWQTPLKQNLHTQSHMRRHPEPTVHRLRINTWDEDLRVAYNQCLACLDVAVIKTVIKAKLNIT